MIGEGIGFGCKRVIGAVLERKGLVAPVAIGNEAFAKTDSSVV